VALRSSRYASEAALVRLRIATVLRSIAGGGNERTSRTATSPTVGSGDLGTGSLCCVGCDHGHGAASEAGACQSGAEDTGSLLRNAYQRVALRNAYLIVVAQAFV
jgi:hypothetical protein